MYICVSVYEYVCVYMCTQPYRLSIRTVGRVSSAPHFSLSPQVLLISLKAGGVALNLTVANFVFIMDPWWNGAAEMQAIDRTHRLGQVRLPASAVPCMVPQLLNVQTHPSPSRLQHKPIYATRFIIENSIEERILALQEKKRLVFDGVCGGDAGSMTRLTVEDMRFLFQ